MAKPEARSAATDVVSGPVAKQKSTTREYAEALGVALLLALLIRMFVVQAFKIPSGSMLPTLQIGDHILVNKFIYGARIEIPLTQVSLGQLPGLHEPRPGDVIVFIWPKDRSKDFIKRVIAVGAQTVEVRSKQVYINGKPWDDPHATFTPPRGGPGTGENYGPYTVPAGTVYVMGDNRDQRSEEHTSELQSRLHLVCRLLLEKKNKGAGGLTRPHPRIEIRD